MSKKGLGGPLPILQALASASYRLNAHAMLKKIFNSRNSGE